MPDWIAHIMFAWIISFILKIKGDKRVIFIIGNVLPDIWRFLIVFGQVLDSDALLTFIFEPINNTSHSLLGVLAYSAFLSIFFQDTFAKPAKAREGLTSNSIKRKISKLWPIESPFFLLFLGGIFHLFLDTFMWPYGSLGIMWLYPLETAYFRWSFKLIWPSTYTAILFLFPFFIIEIIIEWRIKFKRKKEIAHDQQASKRF